MQPLAELTFIFRGQRYIAWISADTPDDVHDVIVYHQLRDDDEELRFMGAGVFGKRFGRVDVTSDGKTVRMNSKLEKRVDEVLRGWRANLLTP